MNRALASIGIAAAVICGSAAPALATDNPIDAKITCISSGRSPAPNPTTTTPAPTPSTTVEAHKPSETKLAKTGSNAAFLVVLVPFIIANGTICILVARKEND